MFDRFSDLSRKVLSAARQEAEQAQHDYLGTEHILLGLLRQEGSVAVAILSFQNADVEKIAARVRELSSKGSALPLPLQLPFTPRAKTALANAEAAAASFSHDYVGTQHLLLGLLRDKDTVASRVLAEFGLTEETVTEAIRIADNEPTDDVAPVSVPGAGDPSTVRVLKPRMSPALVPSEPEGLPFLLRNKVRLTAVVLSLQAPLILLLTTGHHLLGIMLAWGMAMLIYSPHFQPNNLWGLVLIGAGIGHAVAALSISIVDPSWPWVVWCWLTAIVAFYVGDAQLFRNKLVKPTDVI